MEKTNARIANAGSRAELAAEQMLALMSAGKVQPTDATIKQMYAQAEACARAAGQEVP